MIRAVIIGFSHMHVNEIALYISEQPEMELVGIAEVPTQSEALPPYRYTPLWNLSNVREHYCNQVYDDYKEMLTELKPDIAFILSENVQKVEVAEEVAKHGVNICIEKPAAFHAEEAIRIKSSAEKYGVEVMVNWPVLWRPYLHKLKAALKSGIVGTPIKMRYLNGHTGPLGKGAKHRGVTETAQEMSDEERAKTWWHQRSHGGGVFLDIACYGCFFSKWLMGGNEKSVISYGTNLNTPFGDTEDNFAAVIQYDDRMSVIEGTWTTPRALIPSGPVIYCTNGVVTCTGGAEKNPDVKAYDIYGTEIEIPDSVIGDKYRNLPWHYVNHIKTKEPMHPMLSIEKNIEINKLIDAIVASSNSGRKECL